MEKIINYKLKDFLKLEDLELVQQYISILEMLEPAQKMKHIKTLSFGAVTSIRENLNHPTLANLLECVSMITDKVEKDILNLDIITFYSIISGIKNQVIEISNMEENALSDDEVSWEMEAVNASKRMAKFGSLNVINALANDDVTKWHLIEALPYMTVFTKLVMDFERNKINKEVAELQKRKTPTN